jgi:arsenite/tail-anchored protein-transporting ATPase
MGAPVDLAEAGAPQADTDLPPLGRLVDEIERPGKGLVMTMGKGGVGKTTMAAAVAVELAARGHEVLLTTTDPAAHLTETLAGDVPQPDRQPHRPRDRDERYRDHILATKGGLDAAGPRDAGGGPALALHRGDRRVPGVLARDPREQPRRFVVMDTAPTGHTLLLLDATGSYHRDVHAARGRKRRAHRHADDAAAGSRADEDPDRHAARDHAGSGGGPAAGGPAPRRDRALGLGRQREPRRDGTTHPVLAPAPRPRRPEIAAVRDTLASAPRRRADAGRGPGRAGAAARRWSAARRCRR